jgi:hypothetical protein
MNIREDGGRPAMHTCSDEGCNAEGGKRNPREPMLTTRHRNHFVNSKEGRALYGDAE